MLKISFPVAALIACSLLLASVGCGESYPRVSGKITHNGNPIEGLHITFNPAYVDGNAYPGPYSTSVTAADGTYELKTRNEDRGAVAGLHNIVFEWPERVSDDLIADLKVNLKIPALTAEEKSQLESLLAEAISKRKSRPELAIRSVKNFNVPAEGTDQANFDLGAQKEPQYE